MAAGRRTLLLGRGRVGLPESSAIDVEAFSQSFAGKVASADVVQPCATWRVFAVLLAADDR